MCDPGEKGVSAAAAVSGAGAGAAGEGVVALGVRLLDVAMWMLLGVEVKGIGPCGGATGSAEALGRVQGQECGVDELAGLPGMAKWVSRIWAAGWLPAPGCVRLPAGR